MTMMFLQAFFTILFLVLSPVGDQGSVASHTQSQEERIEQFSAVLAVQDDKTAVLSEEIRYNYGNANRHGIYREFDPATAASIQSITQDGENASYKKESANRFRIGDPDVSISGTHQYGIKYSTGRVIESFPGDLQLLRWTADGSWGVPIESGEFTVELPDNVTLMHTACAATLEDLITPLQVTGGDACTQQRNEDGSVTFIRSAELPKTQPLVVSVAYVERPELPVQKEVSSDHRFTVEENGRIHAEGHTTLRFPEPTEYAFTEYAVGLNPLSGSDYLYNNLTITEEDGGRVLFEEIPMASGVRLVPMMLPDRLWQGDVALRYSTDIIGGIADVANRKVMQIFLTEESIYVPVKQRVGKQRYTFVLPQNAITPYAGCKDYPSQHTSDACDIQEHGNELVVSIDDVPKDTIEITITYEEE